jgi:hypothetical protein
MCHNTIRRLTKPLNDRNITPHNKWGIYQLTCNSFQPIYVGQTSRSLKIRFQEHIRYIRNNNPQSAFDHHILHNQHEYGQIYNIMTLLKPLSNPNMLTPYEEFYIQAPSQEGKLISKQHQGETNPLFQTAIHSHPLPHTT